jgi:hypothetical protein
MLKIIGTIVGLIGISNIIDGILSILWAFEPRFLWQMGRLWRTFLGIILIFCSIILWIL